METEGIVWHYTIKDRLSRILADGLIKQATAGIGANERPAVWFSSHPVWEPTANKSILGADGRWRRATREEMLAQGLARIGVMRETAPHDWEAFKKLSGVSGRMACGMKKAGYDVGARISQWFVSFEPVPCEKWISVEVWNGSKWDPFDVPRKTRSLSGRICDCLRVSLPPFCSRATVDDYGTTEAFPLSRNVS